MPLKNTYTKVPVERTVSEISRILANKGATQVATDYGEGAHAVGLRFRVNSPAWAPVLWTARERRRGARHS